MHEHLDEVGIINMNGRIYDPVLGRFLQPDKIIQEPGNLQNHNRYSYVMNNPLKFTDPSGYRATGPGNSGIPPEHNWNHYEHLQAPVLYIDGFRVDKGFGGYAFWMGGGARGGAGNSFSTKMFGFTGGTSASYINSANYDYWLANKGSFYVGGPRGTEENGSPGMEINLPGGSPGNSTGGVDLSGTISLPEIEIQGSYTGSGIVFGKPSYDLWSYVNNYFNQAGSWITDHLYAGANYEFSFGAQAALGVKKALYVNLDPYSSVISEASLDTRDGLKSNHPEMGEKENIMDIGVAYYVGLNYKYVKYKGMGTHEISLGAFGILGGNINFDNQFNIIDWFGGIDVGGKVALFFGMSGDLKAGFKK